MAVTLVESYGDLLRALEDDRRAHSLGATLCTVRPARMRPRTRCIAAEPCHLLCHSRHHGRAIEGPNSLIWLVELVHHYSNPPCSSSRLVRMRVDALSHLRSCGESAPAVPQRVDRRLETVTLAQIVADLANAIVPGEGGGRSWARARLLKPQKQGLRRCFIS
jgi:hypothetical protein